MPSYPTLSPAADPASQDRIALLMLRHQTKNAWQRILCEIWKVAGIEGAPWADPLARRVEERVRLAVGLSDALFGFTRELAPFPERLHAVVKTTVALMGDPAQQIAIETEVAAECPAALQDSVLRIAQELTSNAVVHGLHARLRGRIRAAVSREPGSIRLLVSDDGWGPRPGLPAGDGLALARDLAAEWGGSIGLRREGPLTVAALDLPARPTEAP